VQGINEMEGRSTWGNKVEGGRGSRLTGEKRESRPHEKTDASSRRGKVEGDQMAAEGLGQRGLNRRERKEKLNRLSAARGEGENRGVSKKYDKSSGGI